MDVETSSYLVQVSIIPGIKDQRPTSAYVGLRRPTSAYIVNYITSSLGWTMSVSTALRNT